MNALPTDSNSQTKNIPRAWQWLAPMKEPAQATMDRDRALFTAVQERQRGPVLRFYQWAAPVVSYGRTQHIEPVPGLESVQRPTGGGSVRHDADWCFALIWKREDAAIPWDLWQSYEQIHEWARLSLLDLGVVCDAWHDAAKQNLRGTWCFQSPICYDLMRDGQKIVGGAQWRARQTALHQGSIQVPLDEAGLLVFKNKFADFFKTEWSA